MIPTQKQLLNLTFINRVTSKDFCMGGRHMGGGQGSDGGRGIGVYIATIFGGVTNKQGM